MKKIVLIVSIVIVFVLTTLCGCESKKEDNNDLSNTTTTTTVMVQNVTELGEGDTSFSFSYKAVDGKEKEYIIHTNETIVGKALLNVGLIAGEDGEYGLYVKTVDGITLDYDKDGKYWAFYVNGSYGNAGVDTTTIQSGDVYEFRAE